MIKQAIAAVVMLTAPAVQAQTITHTCSLGGWFSEIEFTVTKDKTRQWTDIESRNKYKNILGTYTETLKGTNYRERTGQLTTTDRKIKLDVKHTTSKYWHTINNVHQTYNGGGLTPWSDFRFEYKPKSDDDTTYWITSSKSGNSMTFEIYGTKEDFSSSQGYHRDIIVDEPCTRKFSR